MCLRELMKESSHTAHHAKQNTLATRSQVASMIYGDAPKAGGVETKNEAEGGAKDEVKDEVKGAPGATDGAADGATGGKAEAK